MTENERLGAILSAAFIAGYKAHEQGMSIKDGLNLLADGIESGREGDPDQIPLFEMKRI